MEKHIGGVAPEQLKAIISRLESFEEERKELAEAVSEVMRAAKNSGLSPKVIKTILKLRAADPEKLAEEEMLLELYQKALDSTPLFEQEENKEQVEEKQAEITKRIREDN